MGTRTTIPANPNEIRFAQAFGLALQALRQSRGLTLKELAVLTKCGYAQVIKYEKGEALPTMFILLRVLSSMGATYETFAKMHVLAMKLVTLAAPEMTLEGLLAADSDEGADNG